MNFLHESAVRVCALCLCASLVGACGPASRASNANTTGGQASGGAPDCANALGGGAAQLPPSAAVVDDGTPTGPYQYRSVTILGGGFVSGIVFSPLVPDLIFARTDVGGAYRWNGDHWMSVSDDLVRNDSNLMGIESIAFDPVDPNVVYLAAGEYVTAGDGFILRSTDAGVSWQRNSIGAPMGGNSDGRSMGERLAVDPRNPRKLFFASRTTGLWRSLDAGTTWTQVSSFPALGAMNIGLTFVLIDPTRGDESGASTIYVGVDDTVNPSLYVSTDAGLTWQPVAGTPSGLMPHHGVRAADGSFYFVFADQAGPNNVTVGAVWKYLPGAAWTDVSPNSALHRFGGISADPTHAGTLMVTTLDEWAPDEIYRTNDGGASWTALGASATRDTQGAQYLYFHSANLTATGWMGDIKIDPFHSSRALYVTGQGIWWSDDVSGCNGATNFVFRDQGLEETVALDLAVPPSGALLLSGVGDIGGFRHDDLAASPPNGMYANPVFGNTTSLDYAELAPNVVVRVGTTSSSRSRRGAWSTDGGSTFTPFATEPSASRGQGSVAIAADGTNIVWAPQGTTAAPATPSVSSDHGQTWIASMGLTSGAKVSADRVNPAIFYAVSTSGMQFLVSHDAGVSFSVTSSSLPRASARPRATFGIEGDVWLATVSGLFHSTDAGSDWTVIDGVQAAYSVSLGKAADAAGYPAIYLSGVVNTLGGLYRSDDGAVTWTRIDDAQHEYGYLNLIAADPTRYGRVFLGTSGRGIVYGEPVPAK